ncbi:AAA family ATPase [Ancylothrix sp. C2]|uniref:AAA family ATPase n=1 Tax=Ancylothrix sp. D3o TaxID=2953691 RepID=UPI0021BB5C77|nr:AAA family ATPase [Ancylothrix sp. D3o]MCT7950561.1 AAA family ATPase [Ancylothrix sp. D3o]
MSAYSISELLHETAKTLVYRGYKQPNRQPVICKIINSEFPTLEETSRLKQEYQILSQLNLAGVIKAYALETFDSRLGLVLEDIGGSSLKSYLKHQKITLQDFLKISIQITEALSGLHLNHIIHKDISPKNIILNPDTFLLKITDLGIACRLSKENPLLSNTNFLEGTIGYISPEQTGRMNRPIDYRTDLYSLGVTFYEMLTGQLPFHGNDPLELIHCHIAITPKPPHLLNPEIPDVISEIIMKLLEKNPEDRYQTASGIKADLEKCLAQLQLAKKIENFPLGREDASGQLLIPQKLYGREAEVAELIAAFQRVCQGAGETLLISGYSGIGKSALVNEIHKPIVGQRGYFIAGKFDQFKRDIPYDSLIQAFQNLMQQLLAESAEKLKIWKERILLALGNNGQVIIEVIPEVELIIGKQPEVPILGPAESQNRFHRVFQEFMRVFAREEHPLVLFLDDLQWADSASLKLIQTALAGAKNPYFLMLGAYRDNEVNSSHPLMQTLEAIKQTGTPVKNITLTPLKPQNISQLIADTLNHPPQIQPLVDLIFNKTNGNPFFFTQLLHSLYQESLITFDYSQQTWQWDIQQIQAVGVTDNVVDLMIGKIQKLPQTTQKLLKLAACIGNKFDLQTLSVIYEKIFIETASDLWPALQEELILPLSKSYKIPLVVGEDTAAAFEFDTRVTYKFLHDRVQQAAYSLIPESEKQSTHLKIGRLLLQSLTNEEQKENIFELVNQLNYGVDLIQSQAEKNQLAHLNLIAGRKAISSTAYQSAAIYLNTGLKLLATDSWQTQYDLTLDLYDTAIEAEYLITNFQQSKALIDIALQKTQTALDKVRIYKRQIQFYISQGDLPASIDTALKSVEILGIPIPTDPETIKEYCGELQKKLQFEKYQIAEFINLPPITDPNKQAAMEVLNTMPGPVYIAKPELLMPMMMTLTSLSIEYGNCGPSSYAYIIYGLLLVGAFKQIDLAYEFGQLALKVLEKYNEKIFKSNVLKVYASHIHSGKHHLREAVDYMQMAIESAQEIGNPEYIGYGCAEYVIYLFFSGENLEIVNQKAAVYAELVENYKQPLGNFYIKIAHQIVLNLLDQAPDKLNLIGSSFDEKTMLSPVKKAGWATLMFCVLLFKLILAYLFKEYDKATVHAAEAPIYYSGVAGMMMDHEYNFYHSLLLLQTCPDDFLNQIEANQAIMQEKAHYAPMNFLHKYHLIEAEKARVLGQKLEAMEYYDQAIQGAKTQGYIQEVALASELAGEFYLTLGREKIAKTYLTDAYKAYQSWGAKAKLQDLESRYSHLIMKRISLPYSNTNGPINATATSTGISDLLDLSTVLKASQAIAGEIVLDKLLDKLMNIVLENAGAQTVFLLSPNNDNWIVKASYSIEPNKVLNSHCQERNSDLPLSLINYVERTAQTVVLSNALEHDIFSRDPYIQNRQPKSILCMPVLHQSQLRNILYLESNILSAFTPKRIEILTLLSTQIAISLENAQLYSNLSEAKSQLEEYSRTLEEKVTERTQQLQRANQDLSDFAHVVSHDLKAPLRSISTIAQWLKTDYNDQLDDDGREQLDFLNEQVKRAQNLITGILQYSRLGKNKSENIEINLTEIVSGVIQSLRPPAHISITIITPLPTLLCDPIQMQQIFQNLISNAIKYHNKPQGKILIACTETEKFWQFSITDNGIGIESKHFDRIFKPFQTVNTTPQPDSTGIGLATVKKIIDLYSGKIWVESQPGAGSTFFFTLAK